ncbi:MAG: alkyl sulfatase C-terminal domain-containing protein [Rhodospirillales bacterium]
MPKLPALGTLNADTLKALTAGMFFDFLGVRLNGTRAEGKTLVINWNFIEPREQYVLNLENSALTYVPGKQARAPTPPLPLHARRWTRSRCARPPLPTR